MTGDTMRFEQPQRHYVFMFHFPDGWIWCLPPAMPWWRRILIRFVIGGEWRRQPEPRTLDQPIITTKEEHAHVEDVQKER